MVVLVQKNCIFDRCDEKSQNIDFSHQFGHISAPNKAETSDESSLKSSDSTFSLGVINFSIFRWCDCVTRREFLKSPM